MLLYEGDKRPDIHIQLDIGRIDGDWFQIASYCHRQGWNRVEGVFAVSGKRDSMPLKGTFFFWMKERQRRQ